MKSDYRARGAPLALAVARWSFHRIRHSSLLPVGLAVSPSRLSPVMMECRWEGLSARKLHSITLMYGAIADTDLPLLRITTWWPRDSSGETPLKYELGQAAHRDNAIQRRNWEASAEPLVRLPEGPFPEHLIEIITEGTRQRSRMLSWQHYSAFRFSWENRTVLVVGRHYLAESFNFETVHDLDPYFEGAIRHIRSWG